MTENRGISLTTKGPRPWREGPFLGPNHWLQIRHIHNKIDTEQYRMAGTEKQERSTQTFTL